MKKNVLLIGAGFSANFGLPIARQVWNKLFNHQEIQCNKILREILMKYFSDSDFESFYDDILNGDLDEHTKNIGIESIIVIFKEFEMQIQFALQNSKTVGVDYLKLLCFLTEFSAKKKGCGYVFSLNQDTLLEHLIHHQIKESIYYPGAIDPYIASKINRSLDHTLPNQERLSNWKSQFHNKHHKDIIPMLVKLHGSHHWISSSDNNSHIVIGKQKAEHIKKEPIFDYYFKDIFRATLAQQVNIWVIGYSFSDEHINEILERSLRECKSSLFIIDIKELKNIFNAVQNRSIFLDQLSGYFPYTLKQLFPMHENLKSIYECKESNGLRISGYERRESTFGYLFDDIANTQELKEVLKIMR